MTKLASLFASATALTLASTAAQAASLNVSNDPLVAYTILGTFAVIVLLLGIGAYTTERRHH